MQRYLLVRVLQALVALFILSMIIFALARVSGDPIYALVGPEATPQDIERIRHAWGLDRPLVVQYGVFLGNVLQGDMGMSLKAHRPALGLVLERLPNTFKLLAVSVVLAVIPAFLLGVLSAVRSGGYIDTFGKAVAVLFQAAPTFWLGLIAIEIFAVKFRILPVAGMGEGWGQFLHFILPAIVMSHFLLAAMLRLIRSSMLDVLDSEFVKMARIKGVSEWVVVWKHALRNALIPVVTFSAVYIATLATQAVVVETVFAWPGFGRLAYDAILTRDYPVVQAVVLTAAVIVMGANLIVDVLYAYIDPRIRYA